MSFVTTVRRSTRALGLALTAILVAGLFLGSASPQPVSADGCAQGQNGTDVTIPDGPSRQGVPGEWVESPITISAAGDAKVASLTFSVVIPHDYQQDLEAEITNEDGSIHFTFWNMNGEDAENLVGTWSTDVFNGQPAGQTWRLRVRDKWGGDIGYIDSWSLTVCSEGGASRADVSVKVYGGWDGISVNAYVGGTQQETLYTARDAFGDAAVLWTFYPPAAGWNVSVAPQLPAGLDPARWQLKLVRIETGGSAVDSPAGASAIIYPGSEHVFYFQLIDSGALPS